MSNENDIAPINEDLNVEVYGIEEIKRKIYTIRGKQVMLDSDVAQLYHCETKYINRVVKRNTARFPDDFCFQLTDEENDSLRCQIVTIKKNGRGEHRKYLPYVFTEHGITMIAGLLNSDVAVEISINIVNAFIEMRKIFFDNQLMLNKINDIELKQLEFQKITNKNFETIFEYIGNHRERKDFGNKCFGINKIDDELIVKSMLEKLKYG